MLFNIYILNVLFFLQIYSNTRKFRSVAVNSMFQENNELESERLEINTIYSIILIFYVKIDYFEIISKFLFFFFFFFFFFFLFFHYQIISWF